ncbi:G patch domain-containing protein 8 [Escovopsis weberi]|uniref:G patch domain-containing protein 8 n=1 Tax=Escovopsis weberi TaxID=150374 RepID=A0A0M9VTK7_ESCWE|nr:G patch domain-containing protein 8 [Escovopsis weberi]
MPPRNQTLPPAQTSSAREAQKSFFCTLCSKGYSRMNDYEAHLSSYDHSHKQRMKDMKAMVRDPNAGARARKAEAKADGMVSIKLPGQDANGPSSAGGGGGGGANGGGGAGFKKGGFKKTGFKSAFAPVESADGSRTTTPVTATPATTSSTPGAAAAASSAFTRPALAQRDALVESDTEDEGYEVYDPRFPTD